MGMGGADLMSFVIAGHSRLKDGVASLAFDPAIHPSSRRMMDARVKPAHDGGENGARP